jgi:hypothetical protein
MRWILLKPRFIKTLLTGFFLMFLISRVTHLQYLQNMLALPVLIWMVYSLISGFFQGKRSRKQFLADFKKFSQVSDPDYIDTCRDSAIAINYSNKTIYLIDGKLKKVLFHADILRWEVILNDTGFVGNLTITDQYGLPLSNNGAFGVPDLVVRHGTRKTADIGHVKFWVNDAENTIISVYVSNEKILDRLKHFGLVTGKKIT